MKKPSDYGISDETDPHIAMALAQLIEQGFVVDSGKRRNGRIVWVAVPETRN
jgi:hypothetical protein